MLMEPEPKKVKNFSGMAREGGRDGVGVCGL
jgi:hypothetical protein